MARVRLGERVGAFIGVALLTHVQPYTAAVFVPVLGVQVVVMLVRRQRLGAAPWALAGAVPGVALFGYYFLTNPVGRAWAERGEMLSPPPLDYLLGFGIIVPLAIAGAYGWLRDEQRAPERLLMIVWAVLGSLALYSAPLYPFERRCVEGLHLPLAVLAAAGTVRYVLPPLGRWLGSRRRARSSYPRISC